MFFFIGGIQPKTVLMEEQPRMCPSCGLYQGRLKRIDHYFSVFFIPVIRVKKGRAFLECQSCGSIQDEAGEGGGQPSKSYPSRCPGCGRSLDRAFRFCPYCGRSI